MHALLAKFCESGCAAGLAVVLPAGLLVLWIGHGKPAAVLGGNL